MVAPADSASMADLVKMYTAWNTHDLRAALLSYLEAGVYNAKRVEAIRAVLAARGQPSR
jgi:hypothetical protein